VVALVLAIFVWFFVKAVNSNSRTVELVPVEIKAPPGTTVAYYSPVTVSVTVRGPTEDLRTVNRFELFAGLDAQPIAFGLQVDQQRGHVDPGVPDVERGHRRQPVHLGAVGGTDLDGGG